MIRRTLLPPPSRDRLILPPVAALAALLLALAAVPVGLAVPSASADPPSDAPPGDAGDDAAATDDDAELTLGRATIEEVLARLRREAALIAEGDMPMPKEADFAQRFRRETSIAQIERRLVHAQDRDAFVDAYIRWQLTSYQPELAELRDREFQRLLIGLPALRENPMADPRVIRTLDNLVERGPLSEEQQESVDALIGKLEDKRDTASALNRAPLGLRAWLLDQHDATGLRPLQLHIERVAAHTASGWDAAPAKSALEACCQASADERDAFLLPDRRRIAVQLQRLLQQRTLYLESIRRRGDRIELDYNEAAVDDFEVNRWLRIITP